VIYDDPIHLYGALAVADAPDGHLIVSNNDVVNAGHQMIEALGMRPI
jgi:hypothetical protein